MASLSSLPEGVSIRVSDPPFNEGAGEIVLRSSDNVDFYVSKWVLSAVSPFFRAMLSLPQPSPSILQSAAESPEAIPFFEDATSLRMLLQFCYPRTVCPEPVIGSIDAVKRCLRISSKFDIEIMRKGAEVYLLRLAETFPETAFLIAWAYELHDVATHAARATLSCKFLSDAETSELSDVPALSIATLFRFRAACYDALSSLKNPDDTWTWISSSDLPPLAHFSETEPQLECFHENVAILIVEGNEDYPCGRFVKDWWWDYVCNLVSGVQAGEGIHSATTLARRKATERIHDCSACKRQGYVSLDKIATALREEIRRRAAKVPLELPF